MLLTDIFAKRIAAAAAAALILAACSRQPAATTGESQTESYHADNDIAMTVRSLTDALRVGEPLDSADYDFTGVFTDGKGRPLYIDSQGAPGQWNVDVLDPRKVVIQNLYLGDLLPYSLERYLTDALGVGSENAVEQEEFADDDEADLDVFDLGGATMRFEIRKGMAANGIEGPLVRIILHAPES